MRRITLHEDDGGYFREFLSLSDGESQLALLAPHGGDIEAGTDVAAISIHEITESDLWGCVGFHESGAFDKYHISSTFIGPPRFPLLSELLSEEHQVVISVHRKSGNSTVVGGRPSRLKDEFVDAFEDEFPTAVEAHTEGKYAGTHPSNVGNVVAKRSGTYVQLELPGQILDNYQPVLVDSVAKVLENEGFAVDWEQKRQIRN